MPNRVTAINGLDSAHTIDTLSDSSLYFDSVSHGL